MKPPVSSENPTGDDTPRREIGLSLDGDKIDGGAARGVEAIKNALKTMPGSAGVYRMIDDKDRVLYVGKAKNLKKRVVAYTRIMQLPIRIARMVAQTVRMEIITTHTEAEALLLESNLIKKLKPRYNILLRDDKSFPYILITEDHDYPRIVKHRGARAKDGSCFGPFASAWAVNNTINHLQRAFLLRSCTDGVFSNRSRPCLLYQIKRCAAPCVDRISKPEYDELVDICRDFLTGRSQKILKQLEADMMDASEKMEFEQAAMYRDRIRALSQIRSHQDINLEGVEEADVIALHQEGGQAVCRSSSSVRARTMATGPTSRAMNSLLKSRKSCRPLSGSFMPINRPPNRSFCRTKSKARNWWKTRLRSITTARSNCSYPSAAASASWLNMR